ncbi:MAG: pitrilysin family protein [Humidesulfovibrio sp.]|uniref:M16 family metallopeptidase n=1 Tax=Humidesulfovibrio sp. TaxID=2910988 RepID=UPI0027EF3051|nr:pitrilysin family protein [Humidesulfovibrio sp.]MDQ7834976.1 pitrilysin family protein [Humidesulfovibrio sp.]
MRRITSRSALWLVPLLALFCATNLLAAGKKSAPRKARPAAVAAVLPASATPAEDLGAGNTLVRLKNGMGVLVREDDRFPLVNIRILVHAGSAYETPAQAGISHVLEHMVFKGAGDMAVGEVARRIEAAGGSLNAGTGFDHTTYYVEVPDQSWKLGLATVVDMTLRPTLDPKELESEKEVVLAELKRGQDSPDSMLFQTVQRMLWKDTSYAWPIIGYTDTVRAVTTRSMRDYIAPLYQPQNMLLCVVGRVKAAEVLAEAERLLGGLSNTGQIVPPVPFPAPKADGPHLEVVRGPWNKVHMALAFPAPDFLSAKMAGLDVLAQVLGGDSTSRLYRKFKYDLRLVDSISVGSSNMERSGVLMVAAELDADKLPKFWDALVAELASFDPADISDQELARARTNIEAGLFLTRETIAGLAGKISHQYAFEGGPQGEANYLLGVAGANRAQLSALYREYFRPERLSAAILAPKDGLIDQAKLLQALKGRWPAKAGASDGAEAGSAKAVRQLKLPGGGTLVLQPDHTLPYTALSLAWPGGDGLLKPSEQGLATLTASMLGRGTAKLSANQLEDFLADRAASLGAGAGTETFSVNAKFPSRFSADMLDLVRQTLVSPAFAEKELARAREDQLNGIKRSEDQPISLLFRNLSGILFASAPQSYKRLGLATDVARMTAAQARDFWARQSREPFVLSVCGTFDEAAITAFAQALEKDLRVEPKAYVPATPAWNPKTSKTLTLKGRKQSHLLVVFPAPGREDLEASARLSVLRAALAGQSGLLFRDLRDRQGLGYTVTAFLSQGKHAGFMAFYIATDPDKVPQAMEGFRKAAEDIGAKALPGAELARAKNILSGEYYQDRQSLLARSGEAAGALVQGYERDMERKLVERAQQVRAEDVRATAGAVLKWDGAFVVQVEP